MLLRRQPAAILKLFLVPLSTFLFTLGCDQSKGAILAVTTPTQDLPAVPSASPASRISDFGFPSFIDASGRYMFYLHGKIIEDVGLPAVSPDFGEYEYAAILKALASHGFVVISEQRSSNTEAEAYARRVVEQIKTLLKAGVPGRSITVVGASKGGYIAATVSFLLDEPDLNYVLIGTCDGGSVDQWLRDGMEFHGNVLTIRDVADLEFSGSCSTLFQKSEGNGLGRYNEIVLQVGTGHGILYKPLDAWVLPVVEWASQ